MTCCTITDITHFLNGMYTQHSRKAEFSSFTFNQTDHITNGLSLRILQFQPIFHMDFYEETLYRWYCQAKKNHREIKRTPITLRRNIGFNSDKQAANGGFNLCNLTFLHICRFSTLIHRYSLQSIIASLI